ncbi:MAG: peptidoglycan DD-metalloendopeptidase family protein [Oceanococcus sp.]
MQRLASLFVVLFIAACSSGGGSSSPAAAEPTPTASATPTATPDAAAPTSTPMPTPTGTAALQDGDNDGIDDAVDNCPDVANANQADSDNDGTGDLCEGPSCSANELALAWPFYGADGSDWVVNNYVDLDAGPGVSDYIGTTGGDARTFNTHQGTDIDVPTFRQMDADFPVLAVAAGSVVAIEDSNFDRNTSCTGEWNFVRVLHNNGFLADYGHLKQGSVTVLPGDAVAVGDILGVVGSSGCSTQPHLHFELRNCDNQTVDPFQLQMWNEPPQYNTALGVMDLVFVAGGMNSIDEIKDPQPNATRVGLAANVGLGLSLAGGQRGDTVTLRLVDPDGATHFSADIDFDQIYRHSFWFKNAAVGVQTGPWVFQVRFNGQLADEYQFEVGI